MQWTLIINKLNVCMYDRVKQLLNKADTVSAVPENTAHILMK